MECLRKTLEAVCGKEKEPENERKVNKVKVKGRLVLMKKNFLDMNDYGASFLDRLYEFFGKGVSIQLITSSNLDPSNEVKERVCKPTLIEKWCAKFTSMAAREASFDVSFEWDPSMGVPGAFLVMNHHHSEFYLKSLTLEDFPGHGKVYFICNSWVYPAHRYKHPRIFFSNKPYLPCDTPPTLLEYRKEELKCLRGEYHESSEMFKEWDRIYDYDCYNDLAYERDRPVLGGSKHPYPRRGKTNRPRNKKDPNTESRLPLLSLDIYVPRDEQFGHIKFSDFLAYAVKSITKLVVPEVKSLFDKTPNEFDSFQDVLDLYKDRNDSTASKLSDCISFEFFRELFRSDGEQKLFKFPTPEVIKADPSAWQTDEEFGREMLAGVNPVVIRRLQEFPPASKLDPEVYGNQTSTIKWEHIKKNMNGLTVDEAIEKNKLFILDHHDALMPFLKRINSTKSKIYASRTILLLLKDGTLKPLAIELSLPHPQGEKHGASSLVLTPSSVDGIEHYIWQLAKAYVAVNDSGYHQLISHWLNTHAVMEPFVIATNRQLSVVHPIHKLLQPHFRDTMNINALARQTLVNANGILELTVFPGKFALELSSAIYEDWVFPDQALPADLIKRGVAVEDSSSPRGLRLLIEDYPFAVDGLEIWFAIETWVSDYISLYYKIDEEVEDDLELKFWWEEIKNEGHGDLKEKPWWSKMQTRAELIQACTTIIWVGSALHAAVNFGQYPYAGYLPNRPTLSRHFMPEPGSKDYTELENEFEKAFLKTITSQLQTILGVSLIETLSRHSSDEIYLGQRDCPEWTSDDKAVKAFKKFADKLVEIGERIVERNEDPRLKNRYGPVKVPYTLLYPNTLDYSRKGGHNVRGIPNSVSI